ncbi:ABC transporter permease [Paenibacillus sp. GCM10027626]|uniref:ABC transporter permease n=1 Tax=Paenibacillus sp. GCM10027626 TaxID=3273411 RepID=UPI00363536CC
MKWIGLEFYKLRRKRIIPMILLFLAVELAWAFISVTMSLSRNPDSAGWEIVLVTVSSMNGLFLPIIAAVVASRVCDMEHKGDTWKMLLAASVKRGHIYGAKYGCACLLMLLAIVVQTAGIASFGLVNGFEQVLPAMLLLRFVAGTLLTSMVVLALQQWLALAVKNQAFGLCLGMIGGFIGMTADMFPLFVRRIFIWTYYTGLSPVAYSYEQETMHIIGRQIDGQLLIIVIAAGLVCYAAGMLHVSRQDV